MVRKRPDHNDGVAVLAFVLSWSAYLLLHGTIFKVCASVLALCGFLLVILPRGE